MARKQTFKRRPNKAGTVVKLSGKRRKPYCAKITMGRDQITGRQIQKSIGTYETWEEANDALTLYRLSSKKIITNQEAQALEPDTFRQIMEIREKDMPTVAELYSKIEAEYVNRFSAGTQRRYKACYKRLKEIHDYKINKLTLPKLQDIFNSFKDKVSKDSLADTKVLVRKIFEQAIIAGAITKDDDLTTYINVESTYKKFEVKHSSFTLSEIKKLFEDNTFEAKLILIYIFTGARPSELLNLPRKNIHLNEINEAKEVSYIIAGIKTQAGKNRIIPIHEVIKPYVEEILGDKDTFMPYFQKVPYEAYKRDIFNKTMKRLDMCHLPHDTRHTFSTLCELNNLNVYTVKRIMGHKFQDLTKDVYTHVLISNLYDEIQKIKVF